MDVVLYQGATSLILNGAGSPAPYKGARFVDVGMKQLEVVMEGSASSITAAVSTLSGWLNEGKRVAGQAGWDWVYLRMVLPDGSAWRTLIQGGELVPIRGPAGRRLAAQTVLLQLERADWWEDDVVRNITFTNGNVTNNALCEFANHDDSGAGDDNWGTMSAITGDLPAPVTLTYSASGVANWETFIGLAAYCDLANLVTMFEGESGTAGAGVVNTITADAGSSLGNYGSRAWNGSSIVTLVYYSPTQAQVSAYGGRFFLPLIRVPISVGAEKFWMQLKLAYDSGGTLEYIYETEPTLLPNNKTLIPLPFVQLPPWPTLNGDSQQVAICLTVWAEAAGAHTLALDFLGLIPMDSYLHFIPKVTTYPNANLVYDPETRNVKNDARSMGTHIPEGEGLWVYPGRSHKVYSLARAGTGSAITWHFFMRMAYRPRRRAL